MMAERTYLSIREVLELLVHEFPDVTISKIRFLESRGLIHPERTPSGYRKFYDADVDRLAWILRQQQEHFLPLKVIKSRLDAGRNGVPSEPVEASLFDDDCAEPPIEPTRLPASADASGNGGLRLIGAPEISGDPDHHEAEQAMELVAAHAGGRTRHDRPDSERRSVATTRRPRHAATPPTVVPEPDAASEPANEAELEPPPSPSEPPSSASPASVNDEAVPLSEAPTRPAAPPASARRPSGAASEVASPPVTAATSTTPSAPEADAAPSDEAEAQSARPRRSHSARPATPAVDLGGGMHLTIEELAASAGVAAAIVTELEEYGLIEGREIAGVHCFDEHALVITRVAAGFRPYGIEARHLKTFKHAAEREAGLFSQIVTPLLRQRNPAARERANASLAELAELGAAIQAALVQAELRNLTGG